MVFSPYDEGFRFCSQCRQWFSKTLYIVDSATGKEIAVRIKRENKCAHEYFDEYVPVSRAIETKKLKSEKYCPNRGCGQPLRLRPKHQPSKRKWFARHGGEYRHD